MKPCNPPLSTCPPSTRYSHVDQPNPNPNSLQHPQPPPPKKRRNLPGTPDPEAEVVALSPRSLMATNRYVCEACGKGFQRDQNLQLHRRGHNLPWRLRQRGAGKEAPRKKVYVCPVETCVHHDPARALGDLTGIKKHYSRKHGEKKWKCHKCNKRYAVRSDWKAHSKTCGTKEYACDCGTIFSRKDSFVTHRAFCDALVQETARISAVARDPDPRSSRFEQASPGNSFHHNNRPILHQRPPPVPEEHKSNSSLPLDHQQLGMMPLPNPDLLIPQVLHIDDDRSMPMYSNDRVVTEYGRIPRYGHSGSPSQDDSQPILARAGEASPTGKAPGTYDCLPETPSSSSAAMSATALFQKAVQMGSSSSPTYSSLFAGLGGFVAGHGARQVDRVDGSAASWSASTGSGSQGDGVFGGFTRDFLGVGREEEGCLKRQFVPPELAGFEGMCSAMDVFGSSHGNRS